MLARPDPFYTHLRQVIVANVDQVLIVASWREPAFWPELVDRYLIAAARNGLVPIICVNKVDLAEDPAEPQTVLRAYCEAGYTVLLTSAQSRLGVDGLRRLLQGRTTALAGLSGVGKSSLLSAVEPGLHLRVGEVSDRRHEGRHTTTQSSLHRLAEGGFVVDTPGIREFGLSGLRRRDLADCYPEIAGAEKRLPVRGLHAYARARLRRQARHPPGPRLADALRQLSQDPRLVARVSISPEQGTVARCALLQNHPPSFSP